MKNLKTRKSKAFRVIRMDFSDWVGTSKGILKDYEKTHKADWN